MNEDYGPDQILADTLKIMLKALGEKKSRAIIDEIWGRPKVLIDKTGGIDA